MGEHDKPVREGSDLMDKVESYTFLLTTQIRDRIQQEGCTPEEYDQLLKNIIDFCKKELRK